MSCALTVIKGYVETLKDGAVDDRARAIQYLTTVSGTGTLTNLVDDLLSSRLDSTPASASKPVHFQPRGAQGAELMHPQRRRGSQADVQAAEGLNPIAGNPDAPELSPTSSKRRRAPGKWHDE